MVLLVTSDNEQFQAEKEVVERSVLIKNMLEGNAPTPLFIVRLTPVVDVGENDQPIPLPNVSSSVLKKASCFGCCVNLVVPLVLICDCHRFSSTANITVESPCQVQKQIRIRTTPANGRQIYRNGTKGSSPWTRRCCLRSSSPPTTLILSPYCMLILGTCPFFFFFSTLFFSDVGCKTVANMIKGKTPEEIRKLFNIVNDFTPEEEVRYLSRLGTSSSSPFVLSQAQIKKENVSRPDLHYR